MATLTGAGDHAAPPARRRTEPRRPLQERGRARYDALLNTLAAMLETQEPDAIGYYQLAEKAGIPPASMYHFFPSKGAAFLALAERYLDVFRKGVRAPLDPARTHGWQDVIRLRHRQSVAYYNANRPAMKLILGAQPFLEVRAADRSADEDISGQILASIDGMFELPPIEAAPRKFLITLSIADAIWRIAYNTHGQITPDYQAEALDACLAYCRGFLPERLVKRAG
ncbi:MAG: TetR/AcrR family transcriptional regulator [Caulobacteraceae bacterium]|nr:TetR/AcrR family transcriptional regulator [Caulobacteraceae bacterium]